LEKNRGNYLNFSHHKDHVDSIQNSFVIFRDINPILAFNQIYRNTRIQAEKGSHHKNIEAEQKKHYFYKKNV